MFKQALIFTGKCLIASSIGAIFGYYTLTISKEVTLREQNRKICKANLQNEFLPLEEKPIKILDWRNK